MAKIGFIGLGNMGLPMAGNLAKKGHDVLGFDLSKANLEAAAKRGIKSGTSARMSPRTPISSSPCCHGQECDANQ